MIRNYFIIAFRNLYRKKMYTFINLFGLSVSIAVCIVGYLIWDYSYHFDQFHENAERIYHIGTTRVINEQDQIFGVSPLPLAPALARDFSGVKRAVRFANQVAIVRVGDKVFNESIHFADEQFFEMFRFELEHGRYDALKSKTDLIITHDMAMKYFGEANVVGQSMTISYANEVKQTYTIGGVLKTLPRNSSLRFGFLLSSEILSDLGVDERNNWSHVTGATFIEVHQVETIQQIKGSESKYIELVRSANPRFPISHLVITPLKDLALEGESFRSHDLQDAPPPSARISLFVTSILLLVMSCFNYMNTSLAMATARLKEIGIRKVMGSPRTQLIFQFLTENVLLCVLAIFAAFGLAEFLVPGWNALFYDIQLSM
ncbi:MAG TPA: ABC transporter permease, partial [bacterium]|nr:ABC transporter permease [bacterium]